MSDSNVYTAERILSKRTLNGVTQYHIKWKGYSYRDCTWEPVENILDRGLLTAFENRTAKKRISNPSSSSNNTSATTVPTPAPPPVPTPTPPTPPPIIEKVEEKAESKTKEAEIQVEPNESSIDIDASQHFRSTSTPIKDSATTITTTNDSVNTTSTNNNSNLKNRRFNSLNIVITDVTVNNETITICESKTNQGFFRDIGRQSEE